VFQTLQPQPDDPLLALIGLFRDDPRPGKLDLGVGTYRDEHGETPVMAVVKSAERALLDTQRTKAYLGPEGDQRFVDLLRPVVFGAAEDFAGRLVGVQTPGGGGALRLGAELIAAARPGATVWLGAPTWPNHRPIMDAVGISVAEYRYFDPATQTLRFDDMAAALSRAEPGDVVLLHGCCHNPTGADLDESQWDSVADLVAERRLIPFVDLAYQGLGRGLDADAYGTRRVIESAEEALVAYSCDKNFGLYRDRTGALFVLARDSAQAATVRSNLLTHARVNWSMPPDHGAAAVRIILEEEGRALRWRAEIAAMCERINGVRRALAAHPDLAFLAEQRGMFSLLPIGREAIAALRRDHGIYMAGSGRINVAGLRTSDAETFIRALDAVGALASTLAAAQP
jgi:aromatic-amino-acid transaminase